MFVITRQMHGEMICHVKERNPWIDRWYLSKTVKDNNLIWTGKLSHAQLFATRLQAKDFFDNGNQQIVRACTVQMISKKKLFKAKLMDQ